MTKTYHISSIMFQGITSKILLFKYEIHTKMIYLYYSVIDCHPVSS